MNSFNFIENKYKKWYFSIIEKAKNENRKKSSGVYYEYHHIIPVCMGGKKRVLLTAREHFICHLLLCKFTQHEFKMKMFYALRAFQMRSDNQKRYFNSKLYQKFRVKYRPRISGKDHPMYGVKTRGSTGYKWFNDGYYEFLISPLNKEPHWVPGRTYNKRGT